MARPAIRGAATASARGRLPDARLAQRGRRRRPGRLAAAEPRRHERGRKPPRLADNDCRPRGAEHAAPAQDAERAAARRACSRPNHRPVDGTDPEHEALLADSVGLALLVVLETLTPAERL